MKRVITQFICDLCKATDEGPGDRPAPFHVIQHDYTDEAGHTKTKEKHVCGQCTHVIVEANKLRPLPFRPRR
jgi:hypothetical protein